MYEEATLGVDTKETELFPTPRLILGIKPLLKKCSCCWDTICLFGVLDTTLIVGARQREPGIERGKERQWNCKPIVAGLQLR